MVNYYPQTQSSPDLDAIFAALADGTRRAIVARLAEGPARVTDLAKPFDMSLPAVSKHIKVLERAGMLIRDKQGRVHSCSLQAGRLDEARDWIERTRAFWEGSLDGLARYLEKTDEGDADED